MYCSLVRVSKICASIGLYKYTNTKSEMSQIAQRDEDLEAKCAFTWTFLLYLLYSYVERGALPLKFCLYGKIVTYYFWF